MLGFAADLGEQSDGKTVQQQPFVKGVREETMTPLSC